MKLTPFLSAVYSQPETALQRQSCYSGWEGCVFLSVERVKRQTTTSTTAEMQAITIKVISADVIVYSFLFNIYPATKKLIPDEIPARRIGNENFSDMIFASTNAANKSLLTS